VGRLAYSCRFIFRFRQIFLFESPSIPTQVVDPSALLTAVLQGTGFTCFVEPSGPATSKPGEPSSNRGSGYEVGGALGGAEAPLLLFAGFACANATNPGSVKTINLP
jgi:hypothetical protein